MSNNKQSSIDWLISQLQKSKDWHRVLNEIRQMSSARVDIIEQAKEMDKEQKRKDCNYWEQMGVLKALKVPNRKTFEQYYTETYKQ